MHTIDRRSQLRDILLARWHPYAWIILVIFLVYAWTLFFDFVYLDDKELIIDNYEFISDIANIPQAFMSRVFPKILVPYYRPLLTVTFMINSKIGGTDPFSYHLVNILIHGVVCCMVFWLLGRFNFKKPQALFFTLFFAIHPALVQAVAWIPGRNDALLTAFTLASFICFVRYLETRERPFYFWHLAFFALGLFTKETAIALVPVCLLYAKFIDRKGLSMSELKSFVLGWIVTIDVWFIVRQIALEGSFGATAYGLSTALVVSSPAIIQYIGKIILPFNLSVFPIIQDTTFVYGALAVGLISYALWRSKEKNVSLIVFGLLWFLLFMAPSLVRISAGLVHDFQEHRMYLPMVGMIIVFGQIDFIRKFDTKRWAAAAAVAALCLLAAVNIRHAANFRDRIAYWENAVATAPSSWLTHLKIAYMYYEAGRYAEAEREYKEAIQLDRIQPAAYAGLGHTYLAQNRLKEAEFEFRRAIASCDANYPSYVSLGTVYYRQGRLNEAARMWVRALNVYPESVDALRNLAIFCVEQNDPKAARFYVGRLRKLGVEPPEEFLRTIEQQ